MWRDECKAVGFIQLLHMVSVSATYQTKIAAYDNIRQGPERTNSLDIWPALFAECQLHHRSHILFSV